MKKIPVTENAVIIRTDFSNQTAWEDLMAVVSEPAGPFVFNLEFCDDRANEGATVKELMKALPKDYPHGFIVVADNTAISQDDYPLLMVDLLEEPGRQFRALAALIPAIDNNLSIGNMGFGEYAEVAEENGVLRRLFE